MTTRAGQIVRGKVVRKYSQWVKKERRIYTFITVAVLDMIKGSKAAKEVVIRQVGGSANGIGMHVPGSAKFKLGEEVLVFLEKSRVSAHHLVMGMSFGKYQIVVNPKTKMKVLQRDLHGVSLAKYDAKKKLKIGHASPTLMKSKPLSTFVQQIRGYLVSPKVTIPKVTIPKPQLKK